MSDTSGMCQLEGNGSLNMKASSVTNGVNSWGVSVFYPTLKNRDDKCLYVKIPTI